ncbi:MAG: DUF1449 family protein [Crocinitomicaceae bacterium]|nr:DUF1449 family protein [Crocinitomicaceae bacterium]
MIHIFFQSSNIIVTVLFLVILIYWLVVLFGVLDFDTFDVDFDLEVDVDVDADVDVDTDVDSSNIFGLNKILHFFNIGRVPFMIFLTFLVLPWWFGVIIVNNFLGFEGFLMGLLVTIAVFFGALFVTKILTSPFVKIFDALDKENAQRDILGTIGEVRMMASATKTGQAQFMVGGAFLILDIRTKEGEAKIGDKVMIVSDSKKDDFYEVEVHYEI